MAKQNDVQNDVGVRAFACNSFFRNIIVYASSDAEPWETINDVSMGVCEAGGRVTQLVESAALLGKPHYLGPISTSSRWKPPCIEVKYKTFVGPSNTMINKSGTLREMVWPIC